MQRMLPGRFYRYKLLAALLLLASISVAQNVQVLVHVTAPYSSQPKDYLQKGNNVMITLINNGTTIQSLRIIPAFSAIQSNVKIALRENFLPITPVTLTAGQTKTLSLNQLKLFNNNVTAEDILIEGITRERYFNNGSLPEGLYKLCIQVRPYNNPTGGTLFAEGCSIFNIQSFDPPIILNPIHNGNVQPLQPQFVNFSWTPSGTTGKTRYAFQLADLSATKFFNANDAFATGNVLPWFEQKNLLTTSLQMDLAKPAMKVGHKYALQVIAYDPQNKTAYKNKGRSQVIVFTYGKPAIPEGKSLTTEQQRSPGKLAQQPCLATSRYEGELKTSDTNNISNGAEIKVGLFSMRNTVFAKRNVLYDGTGEIQIPFIRRSVKVKFEGIQIGEDNRMINGKISAVVSRNVGVTDEDTQMHATAPAALQSKKQGGKSKRLSMMSEAATTLPVPLGTGEGLTMYLLNMVFEPQEAYINAVLPVSNELLFGNEKLLLSATSVAIHPQGFSLADSLKLYLPLKKTYRLPTQSMQMEVRGGEENTFARFDCNGFVSLTISGAIMLDRQLVIPHNNGLEPLENDQTKVQLPFILSEAKSPEDFIIDGLSLSHRFSVPAAPDSIFEATNISIDFSSSRNSKKMLQSQNNISNNWTGLLATDAGVFVQGLNGQKLIASTDILFDAAGIRKIRNGQTNPSTKGAAAQEKLNKQSL